jgi:hypothetical protein
VLVGIVLCGAEDGAMKLLLSACMSAFIFIPCICWYQGDRAWLSILTQIGILWNTFLLMLPPSLPLCCPTLTTPPEKRKAGLIQPGPCFLLSHVGGHRVPAAPPPDPSRLSLAEQWRNSLGCFMPCYRLPDTPRAARPFNKLALIPRQLLRQARPPKPKRRRRTRRTKAPTCKRA